MNKTKRYCVLNRKASIRWKRYFHEIGFVSIIFTIRCLFSELFPTAAVLLFNSYIIYHIFRLYHHLYHIRGYKHDRRKVTNNIMDDSCSSSSLFTLSFLTIITCYWTFLALFKRMKHGGLY